jgi:hypothetical protein
METNAVRRDRHQRLLHPTLFGRGQSHGLRSESCEERRLGAMRAPLEKQRPLGLLSWQLWAIQCCVYIASTVPCTCALHFFSLLASPRPPMMEIRAQPDTGRFAQCIRTRTQ